MLLVALVFFCVDDRGKQVYRGTMFDTILAGGEWGTFRECLQLLYDHATADAVLADLGVRQALKDMPNNVRL